MIDEIVISKQVLKEGLMRQIHDLSRPGAFDIFVLLLAHSEDNFQVQVKRRVLQDLSGYSQQKVNYILKDLERAGFIERMNPKVRRVPSIWVIRFGDMSR